MHCCTVGAHQLAPAPYFSIHPQAGCSQQSIGSHLYRQKPIGYLLSLNLWWRLSRVNLSDNMSKQMVSICHAFTKGLPCYVNREGKWRDLALLKFYRRSHMQVRWGKKSWAYIISPQRQFVSFMYVNVLCLRSFSHLFPHKSPQMNM